MAQDAGRIVSVEATLLEGVGEAGDVNARPWLTSRKGGGVILDLAYHLIMLADRLIRGSVRPIGVRRGVHQSGSKGLEYSEWNDRTAHAETYADIRAQSNDGVALHFEVAKCWTHDARRFVVNTERGLLTLDFDGALGPPNALHLNVMGQRGLVSQDIRYWDRVAAGFYWFLLNGASHTHNLIESTNTLHFIDQLGANFGVER